MLSYYFFQFKRSIKRFVFTKYFGFTKFFNAMIILFQAFVLHNSKVIGYPLKLTIDPSSICILNCPLCPTGQNKRGRTLAKMDFSDFKKIIDEMHSYLYETDLNNWGEPFLNEDIIKMVNYAHKKRIWTSINSNLNIPFTELQAEELIKSGLDQLYVSADGMTQEVYEKYRIKGKIQNVFNNLKLVSKKKKELNSETPVIVWQFLAMKHNEHQIPLLEEKRKELGVNRLVVGCVRGDLAEEIYKEDKVRIDKTKDWLPSTDKLSRYDYEKQERKLKRTYCYYLWLVSAINSNGSVSPCCGVYFEKEDFGNAFKSGFKKIWNNEKYSAARKAIASKKPVSKTVCDNCLRTGFMD
ncbi:MAG: radical SAM protein [Candidatus Diapherotrites archaeon]